MIREELSRFVISDLSEYEVSDVSSALTYLEKGIKCRSTASTSQNETSSRSHAIFSVNLKRKGSKNDYDATTSEKRASVRTL